MPSRREGHRYKRLPDLARKRFRGRGRGQDGPCVLYVKGMSTFAREIASHLRR